MLPSKKLEQWLQFSTLLPVMLLPVMALLCVGCDAAAPSPDTGNDVALDAANRDAANRDAASDGANGDSRLDATADVSTLDTAIDATADSSGDTQLDVRNDTINDARSDATTTFPIRVPTQQSVPGTTEQFPMVDHVCTFTRGGRNAIIYIQATPTGFVQALSHYGTYVDGVRAWMEDLTNNVTAELTNAEYEWGGGHNNDTFTVSIDGTRYRYNHSCYSFGFRAIQSVDCVQTLNSAGNIVTNGCTGRSAPESCVTICAQGETASTRCAPLNAGQLPSLHPDRFSAGNCN